jgi:hypothetical protein
MDAILQSDEWKDQKTFVSPLLPPVFDCTGIPKTRQTRLGMSVHKRLPAVVMAPRPKSNKRGLLQCDFVGRQSTINEAYGQESSEPSEP